MNGPQRQTIYTVYEQYPHAKVGQFASLDDAKAYVAKNRGDMAMPLITSRTVAQDTFEAIFFGHHFHGQGDR